MRVLCFVEAACHPLSVHSLYCSACNQTCYALTSLVNKIIHNFTNFSEMVGKASAQRLSVCIRCLCFKDFQWFTSVQIDGRREIR
jgi:hypothetical protein